MKTKLGSSGLLVASATLMSGCLSMPPLPMGAVPPPYVSPEVVMAQTQKMQEIVTAIVTSQRGGQAPLQVQSAAAAAAPALPRIEEAELAKRMRSLPSIAAPLVVKQERDGFTIGQERFIDPQGKIGNYAVDVASGDATYLVQIGKGKFLLKSNRLSTKATPVVIASVAETSTGVQVDTASGLSIAGQRFFATARGFVLARDDVGFQYAMGDGQRQFVVPSEFQVATLQNGDVGGTQVLLLEKRPEQTATDNSVFGKAMQLGRRLGALEARQDYAFLNLKDGSLIPLTMEVGDKQTNFHFDCYKKKPSQLYSTCDGMITRESLYAEDGSPNRRHYYWRAAWFQTAKGPLAVVLEDLSKEINVIDLANGKRANAYSRALGISDHKFEMDGTGRVRIDYRPAFTWEAIPDAWSVLGEGSVKAGLPAKREVVAGRI